MSQADKVAGSQRSIDAARWFVEHEAGEELEGTRLAAWEEFLSDPENRAAYARLVEWRHAAQALARPPGPTEEELRQDAIAEFSRHRLANVVRARGRRSFWRRKRMPWAFGWVAALVVTLGLSLYLRNAWLQRTVGIEHVYSTASGQQRDFVLEDDSVITLGGDTHLTARFTPAGRTLVLGHGEALFQVHHDRDRPFRVCAQSACVTAVGTVFDVHLYSSHVRVWVQTGSVDVGPSSGQMSDAAEERNRDSTRWMPVRLHQGQGLSYDSHGGPSERIAVDSRTAGAWTAGSLIYYGRPLAEVVEDVERYSAHQVILDAKVAGLLYSGSVLQTGVDQWIRGLPEIFPVKILNCGSAAADASGESAYWCAAHPGGIRVSLR